MSKYVKVDMESLDRVARCCICGRLFYKKSTRQKACDLWKRPGKAPACIAMRKCINSMHKVKKEGKIHVIETSTGCKIIKTRSGRCDKWITCGNRNKCSNDIPFNWNGFTCCNGCVGYVEDTTPPEIYSDFDYITSWDGCGTGYQL